MSESPSVDELQRDRRYAETRNRLLVIQAEAEQVAEDVETEAFEHSARTVAKRAEMLFEDLERADFEGDGRDAGDEVDPWPWTSVGDLVRGD